MTRAPTLSWLTRLPLLAMTGGMLLLAAACGSSSSNTNDAGGGGGADTTKYNFENGMTHQWTSGGGEVFTSLMSSTAQKFQGAASLQANITATAAPIAPSLYSADVNIAPPVAIAPGATVSFHVFIPTGAPIDWVQPYIQEDLTYAFFGTYTTVTTMGGWMNIDVVVPALWVNPIYKMGVQIHNTDAYTGAVYIDSVNW